MSSESPVISVLIPAHNEEAHLPAVLKSLLPLRSQVRAEVIVVDVGSTDGTSAIAAAHQCRVVRSGLVYPGVARNTAVRHASSTVIAFLDGDVAVTTSWVERVLEILDTAQPLAGVLTGAPYGIRPGAGFIERVWFGEMAGSPPSYINAGNLLMRRSEFSSLGGFDETLPTGEDYDLSRRAEKAGMKVVIDDRLKTIHFGYPRSARQFILREAWHGAGDFTSVSRLVGSKVAVATLAFLVSLLLIPSGLVLRSQLLGIAGGVLTVALCLMASYWKRRDNGWSQVVATTPIFFLYFLGRSLGIFLPASLLARWHSQQL